MICSTNRTFLLLYIPRVEGYQPRSALPPAPGGGVASPLLRRRTVQDAVVVRGVYHPPPARQQHQLVLEVPEVRPHKVGIPANLQTETVRSDCEFVGYSSTYIQQYVRSFI